MSETTTENTTSEMSGNNEPTKKSSMKLIIIVLVVLILAGGGGYFFFRKTTTEPVNAQESEKDSKKSSKKESSKETSKEDESEGKSEKSDATTSVEDAIPEDEDVKNIVDLPPFIVNLADDDQARYLRLSVSVGLGGEGGESEKPNTIFITRIRNAMLAVLSVKKSSDILTVKGKAKLRKELLKAAQAASEEPEVKAIYITDFIVQL
ncbi:MAG TPA: flagellar basal body-associated FliL family protein [Pyrinomonadaceae bacterium]|nr:flagellar basal body-associated FliL family protein [Pyrinomonadaceae bacterium]